MALKITPDEMKTRIDSAVTAIKFALTSIIPSTAVVINVGLSDQGNGVISLSAEGSLATAQALRTAIAAAAANRGVTGKVTIVGRRKSPDQDSEGKYTFQAQNLTITVQDFSF